ncbi:MAG: transposase, partial [Planctomycetaceae bacterium]|nr:transposase [Planctomycetaceae bacterium]
MAFYPAKTAEDKAQPLTGEQKQSNKAKSQVRCRIEHVFGEQKMRMGDEVLRTIEMARAKLQIGLRNTVSNMCRLVSLMTGCCRIRKAVLTMICRKFSEEITTVA